MSIRSDLSKIILGFLLLLGGNNVVRAQYQKVTTPVPIFPTFGVEGYCKTKAGVLVDLSEIRYFSGDILKTKINGDIRYLRIVNDRFHTSKTGDFEEHGYTFQSISSAVESENRLDIIARFAELDHKDYIFWKESFVNRSYKQGLLLFDGEGLIEVCAGSGGFSDRH